MGKNTKEARAYHLVFETESIKKELQKRRGTGTLKDLLNKLSKDYINATPLN